MCSCSREELEKLHEEGSRTFERYARTARVFASPSRMDLNSRKKRADSMTPAYPDVCFSIDESHAGFSNVVRLIRPERLLLIASDFLQLPIYF